MIVKSDDNGSLAVDMVSLVTGNESFSKIRVFRSSLIPRKTRTMYPFQRHYILVEKHTMIIVVSIVLSLHKCQGPFLGPRFGFREYIGQLNMVTLVQ